MIKGFSEPKRIPRVGKIYLGVKTQNDKGKEYPTAVDYFVVRPDGVNTMDSAAEAFRKQYGDEPREITIAFPNDELENIMPQYLAAYRGGGGRSELWCKGDGDMAGRADGSGNYVQIPCLYRDCPIYIEGKCKELTRLLFLLPDVEGIGVWELDTTSYHSAQNLVSSIQLIRQLTRGKISMIPLTLRVVPKTVNPDGRTKTVWVLDLKLENIKLADLLNRIPQLGDVEPMQLFEAINHNEMPDDLYVERNVVTDVDIVKVNGGAHTQPGSTDLRREATTTTHLEPVEEDNLAVVASVSLKKYGDGQVGKILLGLPNGGEALEVLTTEPEFLKTMKSLPEGAVVRFDSVQSQRFRNMRELTKLELTSVS